MRTSERSRRRWGRHLVLVASGLIVLALAVPGAAAGAGAGTGTPPGKGWVRVGHFVSGMGAVRISLRPIGVPETKTAITQHASYGTVSTYRKVDPGSYTVTVTMPDAAPGSAPMLSRSLKVKAGQARTLAILGTATAPRLAVLSDDLTPPSAGTARVRLLSATSGTDPVTVTAVDGPTIATDAVAGQATEYATVPAGTWTLQLRSGSATGSLQSVPIVGGSVYTVVVLDGSADAVKLDVVTDAAGAVMAPVGGAKTGLGGMAPGRRAGMNHHVSSWVLGALALALMAATVTFGPTRRRAVRILR